LGQNGVSITLADAAGMLNATAASGNLTLKGGSSNTVAFGPGDATVHGSTGRDIYQFVSGWAGGSDLIYDYNPNIDLLEFQGYPSVNVPKIVAGGPPVTLHLSDGTTVTIVPHV